jgi:hypothetical protein
MGSNAARYKWLEIGHAMHFHHRPKGATWCVSEVTSAVDPTECKKETFKETRRIFAVRGALSSAEEFTVAVSCVSQ